MTDAIVEQFLRAVPSPRESPVPLSTVCRRAHIEDDRLGEAVLTFLKMLGTLHIVTEDGASEPSIRATTDAAAYFIESLAEYVKSGIPILNEWDRTGTIEPPYTDRQVLTGPQFLYLIERQRHQLDPQGEALHRVYAAHVIVKVPAPGSGARYLVEFDARTRQYQLPGGRRLPGDPSMSDTGIRELQANLPDFTYDPDLDDLEELETVEVPEVSRAFGVVTAYAITFFRLQTSRPHLPTDPGARWVTERQLLTSGALLNGTNMVGLRQLAKLLPGGLETLAASLTPARPRWLRNPLWEKARKRPG